MRELIRERLRRVPISGWVGVCFTVAALTYLLPVGTSIAGHLVMLATYEETRCTVLGKELVGASGFTNISPHSARSDGRQYATTDYAPSFVYTYAAGKRQWKVRGYGSHQVMAALTGAKESSAILDRFDVGKSYPCWFDPDEPARAVLTREWRFESLLFTLVGCALLLPAFMAFLLAFEKKRRRL